VSRAALLRAAGAYAEETFRELGVRTLQAAVYAGLRRRDGYLYSPDPRLLPRDPDELHRGLREAWAECRGLRAGIAAHASDLHGFALPPAPGPLPADLSEPLPLARFAAVLRPKDPYARLTLLTNWLRAGDPRRARVELAHAVALARGRADCRPEVLKAQAALAELGGDVEATLFHAAEAFVLQPWEPMAAANLLCYTVAAGSPAQVADALRRYRRGARGAAAAVPVLPYLRRRATRCAARLVQDPEMAALVDRELAFGAAAPLAS